MGGMILLLSLTCLREGEATGSLLGSLFGEQKIGALKDAGADWDGWFPVQMNWIPYRTNPSVTMCQLNHEKHFEAPNKFPMFKDLVHASHCRKHSRTIRLNDLEKLLDSEKANSKVLGPHGFAFHESRCGSTLVANMLTAYDPSHLVYSESKPPSEILNHCSDCTLDEKVKQLRIVMKAMCRSIHHKRCFFKFQSINSFNIEIVHKSFPDVNWIFVHRDPVEVMVSHIGSGEGIQHGMPPCLRSRRNPRDLVLKVADEPKKKVKRYEDARYCAAHLAALCLAAQQAEADSRENGLGSGRGWFVDYKNLANTLATSVFPKHYHLDGTEANTAAALSVSTVYSKGRAGSGKAGVFSSDTEAKHKKAGPHLKKWAAKYLQPLYNAMVADTK